MNIKKIGCLVSILVVFILIGCTTQNNYIQVVFKNYDDSIIKEYIVTSIDQIELNEVEASHMYSGYIFLGWQSTESTSSYHEYTATFSENAFELEFNEDSESYSITGNSLNQYNLVYVKIPSLYENIPIRIIENEAFKYLNVDHVEIENGIETINDGAFIFSAVKKYILPDSIKSIFDYAFAYNANLESMALPNSVSYLGIYIFYKNEEMKELTYTENVDYIPTGLLAETAVKEFTIPNTVKTINIGGLASANLRNLIIPESVNRIKNGGVSSNLSLYTVNILSSDIIIEDYAFLGNYQLQSVTFNEGISVLDEGIFGLNYRLKYVNIPASVHTIKDSAFAGCISLELIYIPESVEFMGNNVFSDCVSLHILTGHQSKPESWTTNWNNEIPVTWGILNQQ